VKLACAALITAGIANIVASLMLLGARDQNGWLFRQAQKSNPKPGKSGHKTDAKLLHDVRATVSSLIVMSVVIFAVLAFLAYAAYRGRYWSRWGVTGVYLLASFTGTLIGIISILQVGSSVEPASFKIPAFIAGIAALGAVILCWLKPSMEYFALNRPAPAPGSAGAGGRPRRGLFAPRPAPSSPARRPTRSEPAPSSGPTPAKTDRSRSKQRASTTNAAVAKGAELARTRAKAASKSRRTES
jgi:hypothetical protein